MKKVVAESIITLEDSDWEKLVEDVAAHLSKAWIPIRDDDDLPDEDGYYLVTAEDEFKDRVLKVAWFTLQNPAVYATPKGFWSNETGKYKNIAWDYIPPAYEEDDDG